MHMEVIGSCTRITGLSVHKFDKAPYEEIQRAAGIILQIITLLALARGCASCETPAVANPVEQRLGAQQMMTGCVLFARLLWQIQEPGRCSYGAIGEKDPDW